MLANLSFIAGSIFDGVVSNAASPNTIMSKVLPLVWWVATGLAVIYVAYGGFLYTTSNGDSNKISEAKTAIMNGCIGLLVILFIAVVFRYLLRLV